MDEATTQTGERQVVQEASARLEQLIAKWRSEIGPYKRHGQFDAADVTRMCADELEALLPALQALETRRHAFTEGLRELAELSDEAIDESDPALFGSFRDMARDLLASSLAGTLKEAEARGNNYYEWTFDGNCPKCKAAGTKEPR